MPCYVTRDPDGRMTTIACTRGPQPAMRCECGRAAVALCDYPTRVVFGEPLQTCDKPLCRDHRVHASNGTDFCIGHSLDVPARAFR